MDAPAAGPNLISIMRFPAETKYDALLTKAMPSKRKMNERGESPMNSGIARKIVKSFQQAESAAQPADKLAPHERQVLELLAQRHLYKEIADQLQLSVPAVNFCIRAFHEQL